jgi:hypothetical protein
VTFRHNQPVLIRGTVVATLGDVALVEVGGPLCRRRAEVPLAALEADAPAVEATVAAERLACRDAACAWCALGAPYADGQHELGERLVPCDAVAIRERDKP